MILRPLAFAGLMLASACARDGDASSTFAGGSQPGTSELASASTSNLDTSTTTSTNTSSSGGGSSSGTASTTASPMGAFDMGLQPDFAPPLLGCQGKIDFLFVIESWYSMKKYQDQLQSAFSAFTTMLGQEFADFDYHIMVVDAADNPLMLNTCGDCYMCIGCQGPGCTDFGGPADYPCNEELNDCDVTVGAGVTITGNFNASNQRCELFDGNRYIVKDEPALAETFHCIASLGEGPKSSLPMRSMVAALDPDMLDGGCNDGFVRNDALLAVIVLNGNQDDLSPGTPESWYDTLVTAKKGNEEAIVVLTVSNDLDLPNPTCEGPLSGPNELRLFAEAAKHGRYERFCIDSYVPALEATAETILEQCSVFVPQ